MTEKPIPSALGESLVAAAVAAANPLLGQWYSQPELERNFAHALAGDLRRLESLELAEQFRHHCPVPGAEPEDYRNRLLELDGSGWALIGIRFRGLDLARPFIALVAASRPLAWPGELLSVADRAARAYALFRPKHLRIFVPSHLELDVDEVGGGYWERRLLAAPIATLQSLPKPDHYRRIMLVQAQDLGFYDGYRAAYEELLHESPGHAEYATAESAEDMQRYLDTGCVFEVYVDSEWAGIVGGFPEREQGLSGLTVAEMFLAGRYRGLGLGAAMQRRFLGELDSALGLLWGAIDVRNVSALRTALRCGRVDVGGYLWLPCA